MMKNVSFFNVFSTSKDIIEIKCPSCGKTCSIQDNICTDCTYNLKDIKNLVLSKYEYYNNAIEFIEKKDYFRSIIEISKYLAFCPEDEKANEIYIYLLYKCNQVDEYKKEVILFENKFKFSPFIMFIEEKGIKNYKVPDKIKVDIDFCKNSFNRIVEEYENYRLKNTSEIIELAKNFFEILQASDEKNNQKLIHDFYDKRLLKFLSKQEISIENSNGKNYEELSDVEKKKIDVIDSISSKKPLNTIITISPAVYVRTKLESREKVVIVGKNKRW